MSQQQQQPEAPPQYSYAWSQWDDEQQYEKMLPGKHRAKIARIRFGDRKGRFVSQGGSPQIDIVFKNAANQEVMNRFTLSEKAGFTLRRLVAAFDPPMNLEAMEKAGVVPEHFADEGFANKNLLNRELEIDVTEEEGDNRKMYLVATPIIHRAKSGPKGATSAPAGPPQMDFSAPPATEEPLPADEPPPDNTVVWTEKLAWNEVVRAWAGVVGPKGQENKTEVDKRNQTWHYAIKERLALRSSTNKNDLTSDDWAAIALKAGMPL